MNDERFHIPGDTIVHSERVYAASANVPDLWGHLMLKVYEVHARGITGKGVRIAINDTGFKSHPFLPQPIAYKSFTGESGDEKNGHGVHCAGIALGRRGDNGKSLGVAPDAELIVAKVLSNGGSGDTRWINGGRVWAAEQGADVISESLGDNGGQPIPADVQAFNQAYERGAIICCAALGNAGFNGRDTVGRPGSYKENLGIAALKEDGKIANFSSGGASADAATPGQNVISCDLRNGFVSMSGTSMACPFMAGVCALVIQWHRMTGRRPPRGWSEWRAYIQTFCDDAGKPGHDHSFGFGVPNLIRLLDSLIPLEYV